MAGCLIRVKLKSVVVRHVDLFAGNGTVIKDLVVVEPVVEDPLWLVEKSVPLP